MSEMNVMDRTGHTRVTWDSSRAEEVTTARATFEALTGQGYRAFRAGDGGRQGARMDTFDASAEEIVMVPQLKGG